MKILFAFLAILAVSGTIARSAINIGNNYWGGSGIDPSTLTNPDPSYWNNFTYTASVVAAAAPSGSGITCDTSGVYDLQKQAGGAKSQNVLQGNDSCTSMCGVGESDAQEGYYNQGYDTMYYCINHCYKTVTASLAMGALGENVGRSSIVTTQAGRNEFIKWIIDTVIEYRSDNDWFCDAVDMLAGAYDWNDGDIPAELAIDKFLIDNPRCAEMDSAGEGLVYADLRQYQINVWADTAKNDSLKYFDSTLPSLHQLGLDTLLNMASVAYYDATGPQIISDAHLTINPTSHSTAISLTTNREAYLHIGLYDLLGRKLEGVGYDGVFEPGSRTVPLQTYALASGTYYLRISTANNEVRTLKLVKTE